MKLSTIIQVLILGIILGVIIGWTFLFQDEYTEVVQRFDVDNNMIYETTEVYPKLSNQIWFAVIVFVLLGSFIVYLIYSDCMWGDVCQ